MSPRQPRQPDVPPFPSSPPAFDEGERASRSRAGLPSQDEQFRQMVEQALREILDHILLDNLSGGTLSEGTLGASVAVGARTVSVINADITQALADAATAQSTADGKIVTYYQASEPAGGSQGDLWIDTNDNNKLYRHNGTSWVLARDAGIAQAISDAAGAQATADGKVTTFYQTATPTAEGEGDLWVDTDDDNHLYRWNGSAWVSTRDGKIAIAQSAADSAQSDATQALADAATAQSTADGKIATFYQASAPTAEGVGDIWVDTNDDNKAYRWSGSSWVSMRDAGIPQAISDAATAQATADGKVTTFYQASAPTAEGVGDLWVDTSTGDVFRWNGSNWNTKIGSSDALRLTNAPAEAGADVTAGKPISDLSGVISAVTAFSLEGEYIMVGYSVGDFNTHPDSENTVLNAQTLMLVPFSPAIDITVTEIKGVFNEDTVDGTQGSPRYVIYADDGTFYPGSLLYESSAFTPANTDGAQHAVTGLSEALNKGELYWIGYWGGSVAEDTFLAAWDGAGVVLGSTEPNSNDARTVLGITVGSGTTAPDPAPSGGVISSGGEVFMLGLKWT